jgi:hypothetical protein
VETAESYESSNLGVLQCLLLRADGRGGDAGFGRRGKGGDRGTEGEREGKGS